MAKTKFDITIIKTPATKTLHAGVGAADLAVETVKAYVADAQKRIEDVQKSVKGFDFEPKAIRSQATTVVGSRVDELSKEATARRDLVEKRVAPLQNDAQKFVTTNVETATDTYETLAKRGATVVRKFRTGTAESMAPADKVVRVATPKNTGSKTTAKKAPTKKAPVKKSTAKKAVKKVPAKTAS